MNDGLGNYRPLIPKHEFADDEDIDQGPSPVRPPRSSRRIGRGLSVAFVALLSLSLLFNLFLGGWTWRLRASLHRMQHSSFAGLTRDIPVSWQHHTPYTGTVENQTEADSLWSHVNVDAGAVALPDAYTSAMHLPEAQRFPWDDDSGLYLLNGYHNLHCLKKIRTAVREYQSGVPLSAPLHHVYHCLDALRQEVLCEADDTPRYTGMGQASKASATHQVRQCRDWDRMEAWAKTYSACWRYADEKDAPADRIEQYRFCPEGSPYAASVERFFG